MLLEGCCSEVVLGTWEGVLKRVDRDLLGSLSELLHKALPTFVSDVLPMLRKIFLALECF